ncbi:putative Metal tolerance protein 5 [Cardiosporidium cionae]|uniref:Metal tolerance protein 5 n=1 Tax=Cardiosporidium cionae TaxID=476202 RepID=A0ABQ7JED6_9APIC|nr:putative Metal tolerance protein 5 [Cardiosporidium cionae]|eukprot:KAF8822361.1 putative Metal tolerance protein 5 [Cardiosporidium cionae]
MEILDESIPVKVVMKPVEISSMSWQDCNVPPTSHRALLPYQRLSFLQRLSSMALHYSFTANVLLLCAKIVALVFSFMLVLVASALDSALDVLSGSILWITARLMKVNEPDKYPAGKSRFEPVGIIVFSTVMATSSFQIIFFSTLSLYQYFSSTRRIVPSSQESSFIVIGITISVILVKAFLYAICRASSSSLAQVYATDHRNDITLNTATLAVILLINIFNAPTWLDDVGGMAIAVHILFNWIHTGISQVKQLAAYRANEDSYFNLASTIKPKGNDFSIHEWKAYHYGPRLFVEIEILIPPEKSLYGVHQIITKLKLAVETLESVERCFVSVEYMKKSMHHGIISENKVLEFD